MFSFCNFFSNFYNFFFIYFFIGTRPALPAVELSADYNHVLEMFYACTDEDYKSRPSAKGLVRFFKNYVKQ